MTSKTERNEDNAANFTDENHTSPVNDIKKEQAAICDQFSQFYTECGYQFVPSQGLLPSEDKTVIFTGATITPLKKTLLEGVSFPGYFMIQKCLRTKDLNSIYDVTTIPDWTNYFTMCGVLASPKPIDEVSEEALELFTQRLQIPQGNIMVLSSSQDRDLSQYWKDKGFAVEENSKPEEFYRWHYGIPNIYGRGITFLLRFNEEDSYRELGNVISIHDDDGKLKAYEFGFGLESLLSKLHGFKKPMEASVVSDVIPYEEGLMEKVINALVTSTVLYHHGIEPGRGRERYILKKIVKGLSFLRRQMGISLDQIKNYSDIYEQAEFSTTSESGDKLVAGITAYENQMTKFTNYASNQVHAHKLKNNVGEYLLEKLKREGRNMGILPPDIDEIVNTVLS